MKRIISALIITAMTAGLSAGELTVGLDQLISSKDVFSAMLKDLPVKTFYDYRKNPDGTEIVKIGAFRPMKTAFYVNCEPYDAGKIKVIVTGRQSLKNINCWCQVDVVLFHPGHDACRETMVAEWAQQQVEFPVLPADVAPVDIEFKLGGSRRCPACGKRFSAALMIVGFSINAESREATDLRRYFEISEIRLEAPFSLKISEKIPDTPLTNAEELRDYYAARQNWESKHNEILASYPKGNRFDAAGYGKLPAAAGADDNFRYFTLAELQALNPDFEIKKIASWSFYDPKIFADLNYLINHNEHVTSAFAVDKVIYATDNQSFLMRYDAAKNVWDYVYDETSFEAKHPRVKSNVSDFKKVYYFDGKVRKLFDFSLIAPPAEIAGNGLLIPGKYALIGDGKVYWLGNRKIYAGNMDFSNPQELPLALPASLAGATLTAVNRIYGHAGSRRLLLDCSVRQNDQDAAVLLELNPLTQAAVTKSTLPPGASWEHIAGGWLFASGKKYWLNPGAGVPLRQWDTAPDAAWRPFLTKSLRRGDFICGPTAAKDRFLYYNMAKPSQSLMLYGFNAAEYQLAEDDSGVLFTMPDGWYQVCRKPDAPAVSPAKAASPPPLRLMSAVDSVKSADSDLLSFRWDKKDGDGILVINAKGTGENSELTISLELPGEDGQYAVEFSDNPQLNFKKGLNVSAKDHQYKEVAVELIDRHTLLVSSSAERLYLHVICKQLPQEIVLKAIYKK